MQAAQGSSASPGRSATSCTTPCVRGRLGSRHAYIAKASIQHTHVPGVHANAETPKHLSCDDARSLARRACSHAAPLALTSRAATPANKVGDSPVGLPIGANNKPLRLGERGEVGCDGRPWVSRAQWRDVRLTPSSCNRRANRHAVVACPRPGSVLLARRGRPVFSPPSALGQNVGVEILYPEESRQLLSTAREHSVC